MTRDEIEEYFTHGRELEFQQKGKTYGISYNETIDGRTFISFYEAYKANSEHLICDVEEFNNIVCNDTTVMKILESLSDNEPPEKWYLY